MVKDSLLDRVITSAEERHLSQNTLMTYRRTWLKVIAWAAAEDVALGTLPLDRAGEFYEEATRGRSASTTFPVRVTTQGFCSMLSELYNRTHGAE